MSAELTAALEGLAELVRARLSKGPSTDAQLAKELGVSHTQLHVALGMLLQVGKVRLTARGGALEVLPAIPPTADPASERAMSEALSAFAAAEPSRDSVAGIVPDPLSLAEADQPDNR